MITLHVKGQIIQAECCDKIVADSLNVLEIRFVFSEEWAGMKKTAQFTQKPSEEEKPVTYNVLLDEFETAAIPNEIKKGVVKISVFGVLDLQRLTTAPLAMPVEESGFIGDGETPIPPTPDLYQQLIGEIEEVAAEAVNRQIMDQRVFLIDSLTTQFSESGERLECYPVPDYPLEVIGHIAPEQAGEGTPSPDNIREISPRRIVRAVVQKPENLWPFGDMTTNDIHIAELEMPIPAGQYVLRATVNNNATGSKYAAIRFEYSSGAEVALQRILTVGEEAIIPINLTGNVNRIILYSVHGSSETGITAAWENVEIAPGSVSMRMVPEAYSGELNWKTGKFTSGAKYLELDGTSEETHLGTKWFLNANGDTSYFVLYLKMSETGVDGRAWMSHFDRLDTLGFNVPGVNVFRCWNTKGQFRLGIRPDLSIISDLTNKAQAEKEFRDYLASLKAAGKPVQLVYETTETTGADIAPCEILSLDGPNIVWSDCGDVTVKGPMDAKHREAQQNARIAALEAAALNA